MGYRTSHLLHPLRFLSTYDRQNLRPDLVAGITVAVILLPQAIAFSSIAELPAEMGLYAAIVAGVIAALWGSSNHVQSGPANAISLLVLSSLVTTVAPGTPEFAVAAGVLAVMVGLFQLTLGLAGLGVLVNFVSHSVVAGFASGAGILIIFKQLRYFLGLDFPGRDLADTISGLVTHFPQTHAFTTALGVLTIATVVICRKWKLRLPGSLIAMISTSLVVYFFRLDQQGVNVIGELPSSFPPLSKLPLDRDMISHLSAGALAVGSIGLVQTSAIARSISTQSGQRLDSNQEFVGQGLANMAAGLFSGYPCAGSFSRSAVNYESGARTSMSAIFSSLFVLIALFTVAPLAAFLPRSALAGVLIVASVGLIDHREILRISRGARSDAAILAVTLLGTLFLHIEFAVLTGILLSFAVYIIKTSVPEVVPVLPDLDFRHFVQRPGQSPCPQLAIMEIRGDLYFGAVHHVEEAIDRFLSRQPDYRFLLLRMKGVNQCDFSGIHALESITRSFRKRGGDVYLTRLQQSILELMQSTGFHEELGPDHFLPGDAAIRHLFHKILDPAVCIYECPFRAFRECQNLPKREYPVEVPLHTEIPAQAVETIASHDLWNQLRQGSSLSIVDVREPREFQRGHIPQARLIPLPQLLAKSGELPTDCTVVLVCRGGRRSTRAAYMLGQKGHDNVLILEGGMLAWEATRLLEAVDLPAKD